MGNAAGAFDLCCAKGPEKSAGDAEIVKALTAAKRLTEIRHSFLRYGCMLTIVFSFTSCTHRVPPSFLRPPTRLVPNGRTRILTTFARSPLLSHAR